MDKEYKAAIYLYDAKYDHVGLGEFENSLAKEIARQAPLLKKNIICIYFSLFQKKS